LKWYALFVRTGEEEHVRLHLERVLSDREMRILIPKRKIIERRGGRNCEKIKTLLPGYVLIKADMSQELYYELKTVPNLIRVLRDESEPVEVLEREIAVILALTDNGDVIDFSSVYKEGNAIRVVDGPLKGLEGIIESYDHRKKRIKIRLDFMGRTRRIDLGAHLVDVYKLSDIKCTTVSMEK